MRVDLYLIPQPDSQTRFLFACRLLEKAYQQKQPVYVHLASAEKAQFFDQLLWTYRDDSFIPHELVEDKSPLNSPILLGYQAKPQTKVDILLNLSEEIPVFHEQFKRVLEIPHAENKALNSQSLCEYYAAKGYTIHTHQIR